MAHDRETKEPNMSLNQYFDFLEQFFALFPVQRRPHTPPIMNNILL